MSVINLDSKIIPMTLVINLDPNNQVVDTSNTFNNSDTATYLVQLRGYHRVKITRFEVLRQVAGASSPLLLSLISPVFQQTAGNYRYPCFLFDLNNINGLGTNFFPDVGRATNVSNDCDYVYNFDGTMPLFIADLYDGWINNQSFFQPVPPPRAYLAILSLSIEKM